MRLRMMIFWCEWGVGLILTVVQCQANPRRGSKALTSSPWKNQSNIVGAVANPTRYQADKNRYYTLILAKRLRSDKNKRDFYHLVCILVVQWIKIKQSDVKSNSFLICIWTIFLDEMILSLD